MRKLPWLLVALLAAPAGAEESAAFLKLGVGARALGLGGAYTAAAGDVDALAWNPAGLASASGRQLAATHAELAGDMRYDHAGFAQALPRGVLALSGGYLSQPPIEARDDSGRAAGSFTAADSVVSVGYAAKAGAALRLGGAVKYVQSRIGSYEARTYAADLGAQYDLGFAGPGALSLGAAVQNFGPGLRYAEQASPLPLAVAAGAAWRLPLGLLISADVKHRPNAHSNEAGMGVEYALLSSFALRGGYASARAANAVSGGAAAVGGLGLGFGVKAFGYSLDYAMTPSGELGSTQRFSLTARF